VIAIRQLWPFLRALWAPILVAALAILLLREPIVAWLQGEDKYDQDILGEWILDARIHQTLPDLAGDLLQARDRYRNLVQRASSADPKARPSTDDIRSALAAADHKREPIEVFLSALCDPVTKVYPGRLPIFPVIYSMTVRFAPELDEKPITWDSGKPRQPQQVHVLPPVRVHERGAWVEMEYQVHVYNRQQLNQRQAVARWRQLCGLGLLLSAATAFWLFLTWRTRRHRETRHLRAEHLANVAERLRLEEALKRQEAERKQQEAERTALELRSQLFANIGIMAGSYAHNIKNLLVRPNDLLGRCLEKQSLSAEDGHMLNEVRQTLGTVTERLQQILQTVRRDPGQSERSRLDLQDLLRELVDTWTELARDKWKLAVHADLAGGGQTPLWIDGDRSHLQQTFENLLFNARDATFEMRNYLREQARKSGDSAPLEDQAAHQRRQGLIAAAAWRGAVWVRSRREGDRAIIEVEDNGIGMTEAVRLRCTETHFSTKRDNALFAGLSAGMGLGLSFVTVILKHHGAELEITSAPQKGACFRVIFPLAT
jgi:signal transduction histidine kinase